MIGNYKGRILKPGETGKPCKYLNCKTQWLFWLILGMVDGVIEQLSIPRKVVRILLDAYSFHRYSEICTLYLKASLNKHDNVKVTSNRAVIWSTSESFHRPVQV